MKFNLLDFNSKDIGMDLGTANILIALRNSCNRERGKRYAWKNSGKH